MFVRKKPNKSGITSVQIIDKSSGRYVVRQTIGSSSDDGEVAFLVKKAKQELRLLTKQTVLLFDQVAKLDFVDTFVNHLDDFSLIGPELLLDKIFNQIGFNTIEEELFRHLVIIRLVCPVSKLKTTDYLFKYKRRHSASQSQTCKYAPSIIGSGEE